ncbi:MAG TPA: GNAT family N-acetyltransferase [Longimicrobiales bacterium]|nr:GNAT family N-acetyltransferase [Longimicrobiales bacterium]
MIAQTERLILRAFSADDAQSIIDLLNDPAFLEFIGDRGVRNLEDAHAYMKRVPLKAVQLKDGPFIGICGLIKRDWLEDHDIGFAYLPAFRTQGYAGEAAQATIDLARKEGMRRLGAIVDPRNERSEKLLARLGFQFERMVQSDKQEELKLWMLELNATNQLD